MVHRGELIHPRLLGAGDQGASLFAAVITRVVRQLLNELLGDTPSVTADTYRDRFSETDAICVDIDLNHFGIVRPIVEAVAREG